MKSGTESLTALRNERKPCHFWVDNEVADCYQAIVGADAIWVYCRIARYANGAWIVSPRLRGTSDTRVSLREMAEWCGKSVDTVWRSLEVLELVGLLQSVRVAKSKGRYALADVKDLVTREGGTYDREIGSFQLPSARAAELKEMVRVLRLKMARKNGTASVVAAAPESNESETATPESADVQSVAQSDRLEERESGELFSANGGKCDSSVAPDVQNCRSSSHVSTKGNLKNSIPPCAPEEPPAPHLPAERRREAQRPASPDAGAEIGLAADFFLELGVPSDFSMRDLAAQAIRIQAAEWGGVMGAYERILAAARRDKAAGEKRWRFWLTDAGYAHADGQEKTGGKANGRDRPSVTKQRVAGNLAALAEAAQRRGFHGPARAAGPVDEAVPGAGSGGIAGGVSGGLREARGEVLAPETRSCDRGAADRSRPGVFSKTG